MKRPLLFLAALTSFTIALQAAPTPTPSANRTLHKSAKTSAVQETLAESANGWSYIKGEWVHPDGYKYVQGKILRTTARAGKRFPKPPGKLALENAQKLSPKTNPASDPAKTAAETAAETKRRNLQPRPAPQTGTHL
jgi:uncharacterized protein with WD repeat